MAHSFNYHGRMFFN